MDRSRPTPIDSEAQKPRHKTRKQRFFERLDADVAWEEWVARVEPFYRNAGDDLRSVPLETLLRVFAMQAVLQISDEDAADELFESLSVASFVGSDVCREHPAVFEPVVICKFRCLMEARGLKRAFVDGLDPALVEEGPQFFLQPPVNVPIGGDLSDERIFSLADIPRRSEPR